MSARKLRRDGSIFRTNGHPLCRGKRHNAVPRINDALVLSAEASEPAIYELTFERTETCLAD